MTNECALWRGSMADYTQLCCSSADGATGVKQLSALAAAAAGGGAGDVIEPGRLPKQRPSAGQLKAPLGSEFTVSSNGSHLFGCHGSTGERWEGGGCGCAGRRGWGGRSRPLKTSRPARKENSTAGSVPGMSTTHGHFTHHTRHNKPVFTLLPPRRFSPYRCLL